MSASPGWDQPQPPAPGWARPPFEQAREPVGYNLNGPVRYEQPPLRPLGPQQRSSSAKGGFFFSLVGFVGSFAVAGAPVAVIGLIMSAVVLRKNPGMQGRERRYAVAGIALGALALVVAVVMLVTQDWSGFSWE
jgi:hypothetical protein